MLKTIPEELTRSDSVVQTLMVKVCEEKLKPIAVVWANKPGRRLRLGMYMYTHHGHRTFYGLLTMN